RILLKESDIAFGDSVEKQLNSLQAQAKTAMLVAVDGELAGIIAVADPVTEDSKTAIEMLKSFGINPIMMTGDNEQTAKAVAHEVGIEEVIAEVMPDQKSAEVKR